VSGAVTGVILAQVSIRSGILSMPSHTVFQAVMSIGSTAAVVALIIAALLPGTRRGSKEMFPHGAGVLPIST
jgi:ABC-type proline/glycine betaine transport system permease subunit